MIGFFLGAVAALMATWLYLSAFPRAAVRFHMALMNARESSAFIHDVIDTYLRRIGVRRGPVIRTLTRQTRRRIARELAKRAV